MKRVVRDAVMNPRRLWLCAALAVALAALGVALAVGLGGRTGRPASATAETGRDAEGTAFFQDVTEPSGLRAVYRNGEEAGLLTILETLGGGVALLDYDGDGLLDVFLTGGGWFDGTSIRGHPCKLFRNLGGFRFRDVTDAVLGPQASFYTHGAAVADYDRDGWPDLLVTGWGRLALYHNVPVDERDPSRGRKFVEVSATAGLPTGLWTTSAAWGDLNGDGWPDLYLCQYVDWSLPHNHPTDCSYDGLTRDVCPPRKFRPLPHKLFHNNQGRTFTDVSREAGLRPDGRGLGVLLVDVNGDGRPDVYVANDTEDNFLYLNRSVSGRLQLEEKGSFLMVSRDGGGASTGSMGVDAADCDGRGRPWLWVTNYENEFHSLYRNDCASGKEMFAYLSGPAGITAIGRHHVGWGTGFLDVDHHGWEDLFVAHGHTLRFPLGGTHRRQRPVLLRNEAGRFHDASVRGGPYFREPHNARGAALGDLDNDGRIDLVISHQNEPAVVLRNVSRGGHWLGVELAGEDRRDVVGARVVLEAGGRRWTRHARGGGSYASSGDRRLVFGLGGTDRVDRVEIAWPGGSTQRWEGLEVGRYWRLTEGQSQAQPLPGPPGAE
jgi:hypothetical protein